MIIKSNRNLYDHFQKKGNEFIYSLIISYYASNPGDETENSKNVPFPLFAPNMYESFYNEITYNMGGTTTPPSNLNGELVGYSAYGGDIYGAFAGFNLGATNHTTYYPYGGPDRSGNTFFTNDFFVKIANGSLLNANEGLLSGWVKIASQKMAYINFLRTLQTKKVHCSNINFQWNQYSLNDSASQFRNNPILFFDQKIDGSVYSNETTLNHHFKPSYFSGSQKEFTTGGFKAFPYNIDVPCDWIFSASSGMSIGFDCLNQYWFTYGINEVTLNFTLHEIK